MRSAWQFSAICYALVLVAWYSSRLRSWKPRGYGDAPLRWKLANFHLMSYGVLDAILVVGFLISLFNATFLLNV
ncbi:hypothetical protein ABEG17_05660 [Pedococcus sp. KACC 23699]|uniref:Uncharacterized protein n=1 Tax=Pedococcus sp. KACC 23699 TaxID=3149228 RepID=A0AAU7JZZ1_9MICO